MKKGWELLLQFLESAMIFFLYSFQSDLRKRYKTTLLSLKDHLDREKYHRKTLDRLVDMVDLSKSQDTS